MTNNSAPTNILSMDNETMIDIFDPLLDVGDPGAITLRAQTISNAVLADPYYVIYKLPGILTPENNQVGTTFQSCPTSVFELCITSP